MEYTKGEWVVWWQDPQDKENSDLRVRVKGADLAGQEDIAIVMAPYNEVKECEANAHLIASAPDLHKGLEGALDEICVLCKRLNPQHASMDDYAGCTSCEDMEQRRLALSKAEGK